MTKLGFVMVSMVAVSGVAGAQPAVKPAAGAPAVPAKPAKPVAYMPVASMPAPPAPVAPTAPAELADLAKTLGGSWKCTGTSKGMDGADTKMTATVKNRLDLDKYWLVTETTVKEGKQTLKMVAYTTYASGKWRRIQMMNDGTQLVGTSDGPKDAKTTFNLDGMGGMGGMGSFQMRDEMDLTNVKTGTVLTGTMSMDKGKTWMPVYSMTCKR